MSMNVTVTNRTILAMRGHSCFHLTLLRHTKIRAAKFFHMTKNIKAMPPRQANITEIWSRKRQKEDTAPWTDNAKKRRVIESDEEEEFTGTLSRFDPSL